MAVLISQSGARNTNGSKSYVRFGDMQYAQLLYEVLQVFLPVFSTLLRGEWRAFCGNQLIEKCDNIMLWRDVH